MKINKKLRAGVMSGLFTAGMVAPIASSVMPAFAEGEMPLQGVDLNTFRDTVEGRDYVPSIILNRGEVERETRPTWELINPNGGDLSGVEVYDDLPQKINNNFPEEYTRAKQSNIIGGFTTEGPFSPYEYAQKYPGNKGNYGGDGFPDTKTSFKSTVYGKFRAGHKGMNFYIYPDWYIHNQDLKIKIRYPKAAKKVVAVKDPETGIYKMEYEDVDMIFTLSEFLYNAKRHMGSTENFETEEFPGMGISASYNPISGFKPANIEGYTCDIRFEDANGRPVDVDVRDKNEPNKIVAKGKVFFTFGSLNFYRKSGESIGMINAPRDTKAFISNDSNVGWNKLKSQTQEPTYGKDGKGDAIMSSPWNSKYQGNTVITPFANDFKDNLLSSNYYRNAVTFACPASESYKFRIATNSLIPPTGKYNDIHHNNPRVVESGDGKNGWQFIMTAPMFSTNPFPKTIEKIEDEKESFLGRPIKTVSDADEHQKKENWINSTDEVMTYNVSYKVGHLLGNLNDYYKNLIIQDSLPKGTSFIDARVMSEGKVISNNCSYDPNTHKVTWEATRDQLGYREMRMIKQKDGTLKQEEVPVPGTLKMLGETYTLQIRVRVNDVSKKAVLENTGSVTVNNKSASTNTVKTHTGKPTTVELEKTVKTPQGDNKLETDPKNTSDSARATILGEDNIYSLYATIPEDIKTYSEFTIEDKLDKQLTLKNGSIKAFLVDENGAEQPYSDFTSSYTKDTKLITFVPTNKDKMKGKAKLRVEFVATLIFQ